MEQTSDTRYRKYGGQVAKRCPNCGCDYFTRIPYNKFKDEPADLFNGDREIIVDYRATLLQCLQCDYKELPTITYGYSSAVDLEIAEEITKILKKRNELNLSKKDS